jgi:putative RNA 2'-phosphotransferase
LVHLSKTYSNAFNAGKVRTEAPVILEIDIRGMEQAGFTVMKAARTVYLAKEVPAEFLKKAEEQEVEEEETAD